MTRKQCQKRIRDLGLTQTKVAHLVGTRPQKVTNRLRGDVPANNISQKMAEVLGIKVSDLPKVKRH
jgi:transcriptional regulator with XRE-family HTH domain